MAQTMSMPPKGFSKKPDRPGRYPRPLSIQTLAAKLGAQRLYTRSRGDAAATTVLIVPAGAGQGHTMAGFARLWTAFTGRRVIGLTTSTDAAPGPCARGPGRELRHRSVPRQRPKAPASVPPAPGRCAGPGRGQPAQHVSSGHAQRGCPAGRGPGHRHRRHRATRGPSKPVACSGCWPRKSPPPGCMRSAASRPSGSGRPASGSATATWPRPQRTTGTAASGAPTNKPPATAPRRCGCSCARDRQGV